MFNSMVCYQPGQSQKGSEKFLNYSVLIVSPFQLIAKCHNVNCLKKITFENLP